MAMTATEPALEPAGHERRRPPPLREWLAPPIPGSALWGWIGPLLVAGFAAVLRFPRLGKPHAVVFDETYYAKDAAALLEFGYEHSVVAKPEGEADRIFLCAESKKGSEIASKAAECKPGDSLDQIWTNGGSFIAHPPGGKWMIAIGEQLFGVTPFGWRFSAAMAGVLSVLILCRVARRMTRSTLLGCAAGLLLALDGLHFVTSRTAILDIFVMFWVLAGFACIVADRDRSRAAMAAKMSAQTEEFGPFVMHWWRIAAGVCLGLACATKWSGIFYVIAFGLMTVIWDMGARRAAGVRRPYTGGLLFDAAPAFVKIVGVGLVTYIATWSGWIFNSGGWNRGKVSGFVLWRPFEALPDLWTYHREMLDFHTKLDAKHEYQSWPWEWLLLNRPVAFYYEDATGCGDAKCSREVLGVGTPAIWWAAVLALVVIFLWWLWLRDWRAGATILAFAAGWLPWFYYAADDRTMFLFYATPMVPFMVLAIILVLGMLIGPADGLPGRRVAGAAAAGAFVLIVLANFYYLYPVLSGDLLTYGEWKARMWFDTWISGGRGDSSGTPSGG